MKWEKLQKLSELSTIQYVNIISTLMRTGDGIQRQVSGTHLATRLSKIKFS